LAKNRTLQRLRRRLVYWGARLTQGLVLPLPFDAAIAAGGTLGRLAFALLGRERQKTIKHLRNAFGQTKQEDEIEQIARRVFINAGRSVAEVMLYPRWNEKRLRERISCDDPEPFFEALRKSRGMVILTAHFGNWELMGAYASRVLGLDLGVIARRLSNPHLDRLVNDYRKRMGIKVFIRGKGARAFYRHVTSGGVLAIVADQDVRRIEGVFVDFFGKPAHTPTGPAELIIRAKIPWTAAVLVRNPDGLTHRLHYRGPFPPPGDETGDHAAAVRRLTEEYTRRIEEIVRKYPEQWMWMHNRWRRKPKKK